MNCSPPIGTYWAFLTGLFILAVGSTCMETIANPYATVLGPPEAGAARIKTDLRDVGSSISVATRGW